MTWILLNFRKCNILFCYKQNKKNEMITSCLRLQSNTCRINTNISIPQKYKSFLLQMFYRNTLLVDVIFFDKPEFFFQLFLIILTYINSVSFIRSWCIHLGYTNCTSWWLSWIMASLSKTVLSTSGSRGMFPGFAYSHVKF